MEMETASSSEAISKKVWKIVRAVLVMVKKSFAKSKLLVDLTLLLKHRTHKLAGKAFHSLLLTSVTPGRPHEFSCNSTPTPRGRGGPHRHHPQLDEAATMAAVQRVLDMINTTTADVEAPDHDDDDDDQSLTSPPPPKQLRITDSPFPVRENNAEEAVQVNKAADDFIDKFYRDLLMQKATPLRSPYYDASSS